MLVHGGGTCDPNELHVSDGPLRGILGFDGIVGELEPRGPTHSPGWRPVAQAEMLHAGADLRSSYRGNQFPLPHGRPEIMRLSGPPRRA